MRKVLLVLFFAGAFGYSFGEEITPTERTDVWYYRGYEPWQEVVSARTPNSKLFRNDDGSYTYRIYIRAVHYLDENGELQDMDVRDTKLQCDMTYSGYADDLFGDKVTDDQIWVHEDGFWRGFAQFNTSAIPDDSTINSVSLTMECVNPGACEPTTHDIMSMENKPESSDGNTVYSDAGNGNLYVNDYDPTLGWHTWDLGSQACTDLEDKLLGDWFAIGTSDYGGGAWYSSAIGYALNTGYIDVDYDPVGVEEIAKLQIARLEIYPNPFSQVTSIKYQVSSSKEKNLPATGYLLPATIKIYDLSGRVIREFNHLTNHQLPITIKWDGRDWNGKLVGSGVYFCELRAGGCSRVKKLIVGR